MKYIPIMLDTLDYEELCSIAYDVRSGIDNDKSTETARTIYDKAVSLDPDKGEAYSGLAACAAIEGDYAKAKELYLKAYKQGCKNGLASVGELYLNGMGMEQDQEKGIDLIRRAAEEGSGRGAYLLSECYASGKMGLEEDAEKAFYWADRSAKAGEPAGWRALGMCYEAGTGCEKDVTKAKEAYETAEGLKDGDAAVHLWEYYQNEAYGEADPEKAQQYLKRACALRSGLALFHMSELYTNGDTVGQDLEKAEEYLTQAAEEGYEDAAYILTEDYCSGRRFPYDLEKAEYWARKAFARGDCRAMAVLYETYCDENCPDYDPVKGFALKEEAAATGDLTALNDVAVSYLSEDGVEADYETGLRLLQENAERGSELSMGALGLAYAMGHGVEPDYDQALAWWKKAADAGSAEVCVRIYSEAYDGIFSDREDSKDLVRDYLTKAADLGHADAMYELGWMYAFEPEYVEQDNVKAAALMKQAVDAGSVIASLNLGRLYRDGELVPQDVEQAIAHFRKAIDAGNTEAMVELGASYLGEKLGEPDPEAALRYFRMAHEAGDDEGTARLGAMEEYGLVSEETAFRLYEEAAEHGNSHGKYYLAIALSDRKKGDPARAVELLKELEQEGSFDVDEIEQRLVVAYREMGNESGFRGMMELAEQGKADAMFDVANAYLCGIGVGKDRDKAVTWFRKAAESGNLDAEKMLGVSVLPTSAKQDEIEEAIVYLKHCAEKGDQDSINTLVNLYSGELNYLYNGNMEELLEFLKELGEEENVSAQSALGYIYDGQWSESFEGCIDKIEAARWYRRAGDHGDTDALCNLALNFHSGDGVPLNHEVEFRLLRDAIDQGSARAKYILALRLAKGSCGITNIEEARRLFLELVNLDPAGEDAGFIGKALSHLGFIALDEGNTEVARQYFGSAINSGTLSGKDLNIVQGYLDQINAQGAGYGGGYGGGYDGSYGGGQSSGYGWSSSGPMEDMYSGSRGPAAGPMSGQGGGQNGQYGGGQGGGQNGQYSGGQSGGQSGSNGGCTALGCGFLIVIAVILLVIAIF